MLYADRVFRHGRFHTLDEPRTAEALAVRGGRIAALGAWSDRAPLVGPATEVVDLEGRTTTPGFHDAHCHILLFGFSLVEVDTRAAMSLAEVGAAVARRAAQAPAGQWLRGGGYNDNRLAERRHPSRAD